MPKQPPKQTSKQPAKPSLKLVIEKLQRDPQRGRSFKTAFKKKSPEQHCIKKKPAPPKSLAHR